jgi:hypothetical protein
MGDAVHRGAYCNPHVEFAQVDKVFATFANNNLEGMVFAEDQARGHTRHTRAHSHTVI